MRWEPTRGRRFDSLLLTPTRIVVGIGAAAAMLAGLMPWAEGTAPGYAGVERVFFSGLAGAGDGLMLILVSLGAGALTLRRSAATSRIRTVRLLPALLVLMAAATWLNGQRAALLEMGAWERRGGSGDIAPGLWLAGVGILLMAAGTIWLLPPVLRWRHRGEDPADLVTVTRRQVAAVVAGIAGTFLGGMAGVGLALQLTGPTVVGTIALGAIFGGVLGAYAGTWCAHVLADLAGSRRPGP